MGSPTFTARDLFSVSINVKIRLEGKEGVGVGRVNGKLLWRITALDFLVPWHSHSISRPLARPELVLLPHSRPVAGHPTGGTWASA